MIKALIITEVKLIIFLLKKFLFIFIKTYSNPFVTNKQNIGNKIIECRVGDKVILENKAKTIQEIIIKTENLPNFLFISFLSFNKFNKPNGISATIKINIRSK